MIRYISFLVLTSFFFSCTDNDDKVIPACSVNNPAQDLEWLKTEIDRRNTNPNEEMKYCYIVQAQLNGEDVFIYEDCNPLVDKAFFILNCEGNTINTQDNPTAFDQIENKIIIWKRNDFACNPTF